VGTRTIGSELEHTRLRHREQRIEQVLVALQDRALYRRDGDEEPPRPLRHAIAGFHAELRLVRDRLSELAAA
jgi:hypothetical protein